jgi:hypothetical protein
MLTWQPRRSLTRQEAPLLVFRIEMCNMTGISETVIILINNKNATLKLELRGIFGHI